MPLSRIEPVTAAPRYMEHRWGTRVTLNLPVSLTAPGHVTQPGLLVNASVSGGFIATATHPRPFCPLAVVIELAQGRRVELPACVTRVTDAGIGVEWRDMACPELVGLLQEAGDGVRLLERDAVFC